ncbi:uncharacterized protein J3R85_010365 [Psidium guajava]|nr:uncharacterized protein J3R85_010365 [Psidium guajava]
MAWFCFSPKVARILLPIYSFLIFCVKKQNNYSTINYLTRRPAMARDPRSNMGECRDPHRQRGLVGSLSNDLIVDSHLIFFISHSGLKSSITYGLLIDLDGRLGE